MIAGQPSANRGKEIDYIRGGGLHQQSGDSEWQRGSGFIGGDLFSCGLT